jgi:Calcineurin-like phosphoesterase
LSGCGYQYSSAFFEDVLSLFTMERRDALKLLTVMATAALSSPALPAHGQEQNAPVDLNRKPTAPAGEVSQVNSPERLLAAEPEIAINPDGEATISFKTVVPTQGATIYLGVPNDEVRLEFPIYSASTPVPEDSPKTDHSAVVDLRVYVTRFAAKMALTGGTLAYRIEVLDPRKPAIQFIDRRVRFLVNNDRYAKGLTVIEGPNLTMVNDATATVWWLTDAESDGSVEVEGKKFQSKAPGTRHVVTIDGLDTGKRHEYRIESRANDDQFSSRMYAFRTAPKEPEFSFVFTCDGRTGGLGGGETALEGINGESARALSIQMLSHDPDFLIFTGDLISGYTSSVEDYRAQLRSWKRIYGPLWRWVPIYTGMGNHESLVDVYDPRSEFDKQGGQNAESIFAEEFVHPLNGPEPEREGLPPYQGAVYSFDYAGCHFVQLNSDYWFSSNPQELGGNYFGRLLPGQLEWLEKDLAAAQKKGPNHIFVFVHEPAFPNGGHVPDALWGGGVVEGIEARDRFWVAASDAKVTAVFHGHEHNYSRMRIDASTPVHRDGSPNPKFKNAVWQIIQGAAGAPFYPRDFTTPWNAHVDKFVTHTWAYCHVTVKGSEAELKTYSYTGELLDQAKLA